jgi:integrase
MPNKNIRNKENRGLPARWRWIHGAIYYRVPPGLESHWNGKQLFRLGKTEPEAYRTWAERVGRVENAKNINQLLDRFALEHIPLKAAPTKRDYTEALPHLRRAFGHMPLGDLKPADIYGYVDTRVSKKDSKRKALTRAKHEISVLSNAFTKAVQWGYIDGHPFKGQTRIEGEAPRDRYVEDWEVDELLGLKPKRKKDPIVMVQAYVKIKRLISIRQRDMLLIQPPRDFTDEGIRVMPSKGRRRRQDGERKGKVLIYTWTPALKEAVAEALAARPVHISPYLFCTRRGTSYVKEKTGNAYGFASLWQRAMKRLLAETKVKERFTEHDIRAKAASDSASDEAAQKLLGHSDIRTTQGIYRRKPSKIVPLR